MTQADLRERMEVARVTLERACDLLMDPTPQRLEDCRVELAMAATSLPGCTAELSRHAGDAVLLAQALRLRQAVQRAGLLLRGAAEHHGKWFQILRAKMGGYTAQGDLAAVSCAARVWLRG